MGYIEHYSNYNSLNNDVVKETENTIGALIIKIICILLILLYIIYKFFYDANDNYIKDNKGYTIISLLIFIGLLFGLDIITFFKLSVFIIFGLFMLALIYKYLDKLRFIILFYHSFNYQLEKIYNETKTNYNEVLFSFIFIAIISIISIVLYWDNIYTDAKKLSKCGKIINTIENNNRMKKPFIYNIIIINNDLIDTTTSKYILKITYDFMKNKTVIDYGTDDGNYGDGSESFKHNTNPHISEFNKKKRKLDSLNEEKARLTQEKERLTQEKITLENKRSDTIYGAKITEITASIADIDASIAKINTGIIKINASITVAENHLTDIEKKNNEIITAQKKLVFYYFNLRTMKSEKIANIDATVLNEGRFKYILVDDNNNKLPHDETAQDLIKFTKIYSKNENYNINIINDIFYAKNNREKLFI
jgi:hypothetical protein